MNHTRGLVMISDNVDYWNSVGYKLSENLDFVVEPDIKKRNNKLTKGRNIMIKNKRE